MKPTTNCSFAGIGGNRKAIWVVVNKVPLKELKVLINVLLLVLKEDMPTLLSMTHMIENSQYISIQVRYVSLGKMPSTDYENLFLDT